MNYVTMGVVNSDNTVDDNMTGVIADGIMTNGTSRGVADVDIVISGMSGRFPESETVEEFARNLFDGVDMVTADGRRWAPGLHGLPERSGKLKSLAHFDATFFSVHTKQANLMDPQLRLLLETTHEAIVDAGLNPAELRGSRTGCYVGVSISESEEIWTGDPNKINGYAITGCSRAMFPNRISYTFDLKGPSYAIETGCSSSMFALAQAVAAMRTGECDAAVVAGVNLCLKPTYALNFQRLGMLSADGRCAAFDASGSGYVRSEAAVVLLLQRRVDARRVYATVRCARMNNDGYKPEGITFPAGNMQRQLTTETFENAGLHLQDIVYVEAHGTGTKVGDPQEVNAIADFFCKKRKTPLLIGSVKSNMGHSEPAAGLCSIVKVLIAMERRIIPGNLHYKSPNIDSPALSDGRIKVVDRNTPWIGGLVAVNSFGWGGSNAHVVLESDPDVPCVEQDAYSLPRLILASGRTDYAVRTLLTHVTAHSNDAGLHALLDAVHAKNILGHTHRGYKLLGSASIEEVVEMDIIEPRPVWFIFSGMASQSTRVARSLMRIPAFATSVQRSAAVLQPYGVDLVHVLTEAPESAFEDVINSFVSIVAVQVALIDVLRAVGIRPDGYIGTSVGELCCAYVDETLTAEQTVLAAYWRGRSILDAKLPPGAMATVMGLTYEQCLARCPSDIDIACHNSALSVTVSGPAQSIEKFVAELTAEGVFARRIFTSGVAFHSKYIAAAAPLLHAHLKTLISSPKQRTARWISSSLSRDQWNSKIGKLSDADYFVNNLLSSVRLEEALQSIPKGALLIEIAPHAHLQAILKRALPEPTIHVGLLRRESPDSALHLLTALGKIYCAGAQPQPGTLYPSVSWPVPRGTPGLASQVLWDHSTEWSVANFTATTHLGGNVIEFDLSKPGDAFLAGHEIDGNVIFPPIGYITLVWRTMAMRYNKKIENTAIVLEDLQFGQETIVPRDNPVRFLVNILEAGEFNVCESGNVVMSGKVRLSSDPAADRTSKNMSAATEAAKLVPLTADDIYKELRLKGYNYTNVFRGIKSADESITVGELSWNGSWISFMDTMLQFNTINPTVHLEVASETDTFIVHRCKHIDLIATRGIEIHGIKSSPVVRRYKPQLPPKLEKFVFVPYNTDSGINNTHSKKDALTVSMQIVLENAGTFHIKVSEAALDRPAVALLTPEVLQILEAEPQARAECTLFVSSPPPTYNAAVQHLGVKVIAKDVYREPLDISCHLVLAANVIVRHQEDLLAQLAASLADTGMLLLEEPHGTLDNCATAQTLERAGLLFVSRQVAVNCDYVLLKRRNELPVKRIVIQINEDDEFLWVEPLRTALKQAETEQIRLYIVSRQVNSGILGLARCLRTEPGAYAVRVFYLPRAVEPFSLTSSIYTTQLRNDLAINVLCAEVWGSYKHLLLGSTSSAQLKVEHAYVHTLIRGGLSSLRWINSPLSYASEQPCPAHMEQCDVYYASLNLRDVMLATGKLSSDKLLDIHNSQEYDLGLEFSGHTLNGKRVIGLVTGRGLATTVMVESSLLWEFPETWKLEQAATVPVAYMTAYYALVVRGQMRPGEALLVHDGAGSVGQAAITIALHAGCRVFTTVDTPHNRSFLLERFPMLNDNDIGNSSDGLFEEMVRQRTSDRGVDMVLNSLADLRASVHCLAEGGRFLQIGNLGVPNKSFLNMTILKNITFHCIQLEALLKVGDDNADKAAVARCMAAGLAQGVVKPLPSTVFEQNQLEQAFNCVAIGKDIRKVLIRVREEKTSSVYPNKTLVTAPPRTYFHQAKSYILVGGLGGFGLELGQWLIKRGATRLVFNSRSGVRTGYQAWRIRRWREAGIQVVVSTADATNVGSARELLREAADLGPIGGIFNLAAVLSSAFLEHQSAASFKAVTKPKIDGTKALDIVTRELAPALDHFVAFSSVVSGRGSHGLSNYGYANSAMERICEQRRNDGLAALAIQWGTIGEVGMVMDVNGSDDVVVDGLVPQRLASCMDALDMLLAQPNPVACSMVLAKTHRISTRPQRDIVNVIANILGIKNPSKTTEFLSLVELGMDSLMIAEIKQSLERNYDLVLSVQEIRTLTFAKIRKMALASDIRND